MSRMPTASTPLVASAILLASLMLLPNVVAGFGLVAPHSPAYPSVAAAASWRSAKQQKWPWSTTTTTSSSTSTSTTSTSTSLFAIRCEEKFYQLEEMEDKETCTTELYLKSDRTVQFGQTDGPLFVDATGSWQVKPGTNDFTMVLSRTYGTGSSARDMGEFQYDVRRTYVGEMTQVGASVGITGVAHTYGPAVEGNQEVGFFNMIDATDLRDSYGKEGEQGGVAATS